MKTLLLTSITLMFLGMPPALSYAAAQGGTITHLSGTLSVKKPDGSVRLLSQKSGVAAGDTLATEKDSYAQINFADGSQMTMRPNSQMKIEAFKYDEGKPQEDNAFFRLIKGGLRTVTGLVGKRGNLDAYKIGTATATIGIRGSSGDTIDCTQDCTGVTPTSSQKDKGLYHTTYTGSYVMTNDAGSIIIGEGQFGFVRDVKTAPVLLAADPGFNLNVLPFILNIFEGSRLGPGDKAECQVR